MYEGAGEAIPMVDVPVPVGQARRSFHRIAFVCGLGGAAVLAWHIFRKLKAAQQEREAKEKAEAIISKEKTVAESEAEINNNNRWRHPLRNPLPTVQVVIHQCPRGYLTPCISPFSLKLETYLRVAGIPYEVKFCLKFSRQLTVCEFELILVPPGGLYGVARGWKRTLDERWWRRRARVVRMH